MFRAPCVLALALAQLLVAACAPTEGPELGQSLRSVSIGNGVTLNGTTLNGVTLNGVTLNGVTLNGVTLNGVTLNGVTLNGVTLNGVTLNGVTLNGTLLSGSDFIGAQMNGTLSDGTPVTLRIADIRAGTAPNDDVYYYWVEWQSVDGWLPICKSDAAGQPLPAIPVVGFWDYRQGVPGGGAYTYDPAIITWGCRHSSAAQCVEALQYKPWKTAAGVSLGDHHRACVRALRADFCGDGRSHTEDGHLVNIYDAIGVQDDTERWPIEAEWDVAGARCFMPHRRSAVNDQMTCDQGNQDVRRCGAYTDFRSGTLLMTEIPASSR